MPRLSRMAFAVLLAAILTTTATLADPLWGAQPRRIEIAASTPTDLAARFWRFLVRGWTKNGSQMDPSGVPVKNGSQADPDGIPVKNGSMMEPNGSSLQIPVPMTTNGDNGHQVDPDG